MDEHVITLLTRDETESLFCIEKLHCTLRHGYSYLKIERPTNSISSSFPTLVVARALAATASGSWSCPQKHLRPQHQGCGRKVCQFRPLA
jgi:hypothetical protein